MKKFIIISAVMTASILIMLLTMCFIKTAPNFTYSQPSSVMAYAKSSVAIKNGKGDSEFSPNSQTYKDLTSEVDKMFKISMFKRVIKGDTVNPVVGQDIEGKTDSWSSTLLSKNYAVAFNYKKKQRQIVNYDGDTKVVEYYGFVIILSEESSFTEVKIYFKTGTDSSYTNNPMLAYGNTKNLIKAIENLK